MSIYNQDIFSPEPLNKLGAAGAPDGNDDVTKGYSPGSMWCDVTAAPKQMYECIDTAKGAAVWVLMSGAGGGGVVSIISPAIVALIAAGAIGVGDTIPDGSTLDDFARQLLLTTYYPTFVAPTATLVTDKASSLESGTTGDILLTLTLNRGSILGKLVGGFWNPATFQDYRAGAATNYNIAGVDRLLVNTYTVPAFQILDGANTWPSTVLHAVGPQATDSSGADYLTPLAAGSLSPSVTITGRRNAFYGHDSVNNVTYTLSSEVRALPSTRLNPANGTTFTINIPIGAKMVVFAYPSTLRDVSSVLYVEGMNAEIKDAFTKTTVSVEGASGYTAINYKVYTYIPVEPFSATATYNVTI